MVAGICLMDGQLARARSVVTDVCFMEDSQVSFTRWRMSHVSSDLAFSVPHSARRQAT